MLAEKSLAAPIRPMSDVIFVGIILMGVTGALLDATVRFIERLVIPWRGKG